MGRLAWTSELEYHPDMIMFLEPRLDDVTKAEIAGQLTLDIVKQRTGKAGVKIHLAFDKATQRMTEL